MEQNILNLIGCPSRDKLIQDEYCIGRLIWPILFITFAYLPCCLVVIFIRDPFPGHSLEFLLAGQVTGVCMVASGYKNKGLKLALIIGSVTIASLNEFHNFLPGPGVKDIVDVYCYLGGAFVTYIAITLLRKSAVTLLLVKVFPPLVRRERSIISEGEWNSTRHSD